MIYENGNISVDSHFARFGSKSYAIDKVNSVDIREEKKQGSLWMALAGLGALLFLAALGSGDVSTWIVCLVVSGLAVLAYIKRPQPVYHLMLATSSGEVQATNTGNRETIMELRAAIEMAMVTRGRGD